MNDWEYIKWFYKKVLGVDSNLVDLIADYDILKLCAEGWSNRHISNELELDLETVTSLIGWHFGFSGFENDLGLNTKMMYTGSKLNKYMFIQQCRTLSPETPEEDFNMAFKINKVFDKIERKVLIYATGKRS
jgi:hypothetical protein